MDIPPRPGRFAVHHGPTPVPHSPRMDQVFPVREITPALNALIDNMDLPNVPMEFGKDYPRHGDGGALNLSFAGMGTVSRETVQFPPPTSPRPVISAPVPPSFARIIPPNELVMAAAVQFGRSLPIWVASDTAANITKYPPSAYPPNALFLATDTSIFYHDTGNAWVPIPFGQVITTPTVSLQVGGSATGITGTQTCSAITTGKQVLLLISIALTNKGSGSGNVTLVLGTIPAVAIGGMGIVSNLSNMLLLTSAVDAFLPASSTTIALSQTGATGSASLTDANLTNTSAFNLALSYQSS